MRDMARKLLLLISVTLSKDLLFPRFGALLQETKGVVITGRRNIQIRLLDSFKPEHDLQEKNCSRRNTTHDTNARNLFRKMFKEDLQGYNFELEEQTQVEEQKTGGRQAIVPAPEFVRTDAEKICTFIGDECTEYVNNTGSFLFADGRKDMSQFSLTASLVVPSNLMQEVQKQVLVKNSITRDILAYGFETKPLNMTIALKQGAQIGGPQIKIFFDSEPGKCNNTCGIDVELSGYVEKDVIEGSVIWAARHHQPETAEITLVDNLPEPAEYASNEYEEYASFQDGYKRRRRSFFGLVTGQEVDQKITAAIMLSEKMNKELTSLNEDEIQALSEAVHKNGIAIVNNSNSLMSMLHQLCNQAFDTQRQIIQNDLKIYYRFIIDQLISALVDCRMNRFPMAFGKKILAKLCHLHIDKEKCKWAIPTLQRLIGCSPGVTYLGTDNILIEFNLTVPINYDQEYVMYKPFVVPTFSGNQTVKMVDGFKDKYIIRIGNSGEAKMLNNCDEVHGILECSTETEIDQGIVGCVRGMFKDEATTCKFRENKQRQTCFARRAGNGLLISTMEELEIHKQDKKSVFASKEQIAKGVNFIRNDLTSTKSVNCGGMVITTELTEQFELELQVNSGLNWTELVKNSETHLGHLEASFSKQQDILNGNIRQINETMGTLTDRLKDKKINMRELVPEDTKQRTLLLAMVITASVLLTVLLTIGIIFWCRKRKGSISERERIQDVTRRQRKPDFISEPIIQDNRTPMITFPISRPSILNSPFSTYQA